MLLLPLAEYEGVGVPDVLLEFFEGCALADDLGFLDQLTNKPISVFSVLEGKRHLYGEFVHGDLVSYRLSDQRSSFLYCTLPLTTFHYLSLHRYPQITK